MKECTFKVTIFISIKTNQDLQLERDSPVATTIFETW